MADLSKYEFDTQGWAAQQLAQLNEKGGGESANFMKLKNGRNVVRILPGEDMPSTFLVYRQHFLKNGDKKMSFECPGNGCPACAYRNKLRRTGNPADFEAAQDFYAKVRVLINVIDRSEPEKGVQVLAVGKDLYGQLLEMLSDQDTGVNYAHPTKGYDVIITREGTGKFDTKYKAKVMPKSSPLAATTDEAAELLESAHDLAKFAKKADVAEINGFINGDSAPFIEVSAPRKQLGGAPRRAPSVADEFNEDVPF